MNILALSMTGLSPSIGWAFRPASKRRRFYNRVDDIRPSEYWGPGLLNKWLRGMPKRRRLNLVEDDLIVLVDPSFTTSFAKGTPELFGALSDWVGLHDRVHLRMGLAFDATDMDDAEAWRKAKDSRHVEFQSDHAYRLLGHYMRMEMKTQ